MVAADEDSSDMLDYCIKGQTDEIATWGSEYMRTLAGHVGIQYDKNVADGKPNEDLFSLVDLIVPHFIDHNEEPEAVDLMMETE